MRLEVQPIGEEEGRKRWPGKPKEGIKFSYKVNMGLEEPPGRVLQEEALSWG